MDEATFRKFLAATQSVYGPIELDTYTIPPSWFPPLLTEGEGRYLWTDAFGVVNFLTLFKSTGDRRYLIFAADLITAVHECLGRTRDRTRRLPGATDESPLAGGLRIGKKDELGPDGDGQYHHYLTLWMFALNRMAVATGQEWYNKQAINLAKSIHDKFVYQRHSSRPRMYWKMSMDLSKPLTTSEGNLDPIDGYLTLRLLKKTAEENHMGGGGDKLDEELRDYKKIVDKKWAGYESSDALDIGMTLWSAHSSLGCQEEDWARGLCERMLHCLDYYNQLKTRPHKYRLAFREFGLVLGLRTYATQEPSTTEADMLYSLAEEIVCGWEKWDPLPEARKTPTDLKPITLVMYCAALHPGAFTKGYLEHRLT
ncbi:hypothetical protein L211DRAFT_863152 [Terfezia boudieri ATCC MYA-4762]|uniref:Uncharacterized protein n=1 Tax=Terfezia boudieri ATCC MYA-4762 TaxID=1051890 RepID=A0A3N4LDC8_9PEZI|nr:hypothetical protein L211DRAFT_863152 [Terfezia boudieri ATCC MYA-4762]